MDWRIDHKHDVAIIGAGPVGIFAAFQAGMLEISPIVIDVLPEIGGQCTALYPEKPIFDIPAFPSVSGADLIDNLESQAKPFNPTYLLGHRVLRLEKTTDGFILVTDKDVNIFAKSIIIAAGCGAFTPNRPPLENLEEFEGTSVFYSVKKKQDFTGKRIVIAGGGDSAVDWAIGLYDLAEHIYLVHRRDKFRAIPANLTKLQELAAKANSKLEFVTPYQLSGLEGKNGILENVLVKDFDEKEKSLKANCLLAFFGSAMDMGSITTWGLNMDEFNRHILVNQSDMSTNIKGVYAIGDVAHYEHKLKLILTGFAEAASACHASYKIVHPDKALHFEYSTTKGLPGA